MKKLVLASMTMAAIGCSASALAFDFSKVTSAVSAVSGSSANNTADLSGFLANAELVNNLFSTSRTQLALMLTDQKTAAELQAKLDSLKNTSDAKERAATQAQINTMSQAVLDAAKKDQDAAVAQLQSASTAKKEKAVAALTNFGLAALKASDLAPQGKAVSSNLMTNPTLLLNSGYNASQFKDLYSNLTGIASNSAFALKDMPKIFLNAKIKVEMPTSSASKPVEIKDL